MKSESDSCSVFLIKIRFGLMEIPRSKPVRKLPETIHSLLGLKSHLTSAWVKSVCNIVKNVSSPEISSSSPSKEEEDDSVSAQEQSIRGTSLGFLFFFFRSFTFFGYLFLNEYFIFF